MQGHNSQHVSRSPPKDYFSQNSHQLSCLAVDYRVPGGLIACSEHRFNLVHIPVGLLTLRRPLRLGALPRVPITHPATLVPMHFGGHFHKLGGKLKRNAAQAPLIEVLRSCEALAIDYQARLGNPNQIALMLDQ